jgi:hypothetical protein
VSRDLLTIVAALAAAGAIAGCGGDNSAAPGASPSGQTAHPVAGSFEPDDTKLAECEGDVACLEQGFGNLTYEDGPKTAISVLEQRMATDSVVQSDCHRIAHILGAAALVRYEGNVARAFVEGSAVCSSGYYHGLLERAFAGVSSRDELAGVARDLCNDPEITRTTYHEYQCLHGLGHGLMIHTGYQLPFSLSVCDRLRTSWEQTSCTGGVFMENVSSSYGIESRWVKEDDLVYPCTVVERRHKLYCYLLVTSRILPETEYDWKKTASICSGVERDWVDSCFQSYGRDASGFSRQNVRRTASLCRTAGSGEGECLFGAARDMANDYPDGVPRAGRLCSGAPARLRERCFFGVGTILGTVTTTAGERTRLCRRHTSRKYLNDCLEGAGAS